MRNAYIITGVIFVFGMFAIVGIFNEVTGDFTFGQSGIGRYSAPGGWVQFSPKEACEIAGGQSFDPVRIVHNEFNTVMAVCYNNYPNLESDYFQVPVVQWVYNKPRPGQYSPTG